MQQYDIKGFKLSAGDAGKAQDVSFDSGKFKLLVNKTSGSLTLVGEDGTDNRDGDKPSQWENFYEYFTVAEYGLLLMHEKAESSAEISLKYFQNFCEEWKKLYPEVLKRYHICVKRILMSFSRGFWVDSLIDSAIALENLFSGNTEIRYRISASVAKVLSPEEGTREIIISNVKNFYDLRSAIVHGGTFEELSNKLKRFFNDGGIGLVQRYIEEYFPDMNFYSA